MHTHDGNKISIKDEYCSAIFISVCSEILNLVCSVIFNLVCNAIIFLILVRLCLQYDSVLVCSAIYYIAISLLGHRRIY